MKKKQFKSGFIAVVGKPNVGKSTLVNRLLGKKISIISPKSQTTRQRILGAKTTKHAQLIFVDTPGLISPDHLLGRRMVKHSLESLADCDLCLFVVQATHRDPREKDLWAYRMLQRELHQRRPFPPVYLVVNKVDEVKDKSKLLPVIQSYSMLGAFAEIFPISALKDDNLDQLEETIIRQLPEGPAYFSAENRENQDEKFRISEIIREKVLYCVHEEVPHGVAVAVDEVRPGHDQKTLYVRATIYVQRESHKGIVVGAQGKMLKKIGIQARLDLSKEKGRPVFVDLWVKVKKDWQEREELLNLFGYA